MEYDAFSSGIEIDGLRNKTDIGVLICFMLENSEKPFSRSDLIDIIQTKGMANYFETTAAISELIKNNNIICAENGDVLELTDNGRLIASQLHTQLPLTIRQKAVSAVRKLERRRRIEHENPVSISKADGGGYNVTLRVTDGLRDLMSLTVFVPDKKEANHIKKTFLNDPERLYSLMLAGVIGEKNMIEDALKELGDE